jgi:PAS domain
MLRQQQQQQLRQLVVLSSFSSSSFGRSLGPCWIRSYSKHSPILSSVSFQQYYADPKTKNRNDVDHVNLLTYCITHTMVDNHHETIRYNIARCFQQQEQLQQQPNGSLPSSPKGEDRLYLDWKKTSEENRFGTSSKTTTNTTTTTRKEAVVGAVDNQPLPQYYEDAISFLHDDRAIIMTECTPPYRIVHVNDCWCTLCGYKYHEVMHHTIGSILHGPATNSYAATALIAQLINQSTFFTLSNPSNKKKKKDDTDGVSSYDIGTTLINYKKDGTPFRNRIRVGPIYDTNNTMITHYVGVLQEMPM